MAMTVKRGSAMNESLVLRCTLADKAQLKLAAQQEGLSVSDLVRRLLIQNRYIDAISPCSNNGINI